MGLYSYCPHWSPVQLRNFSQFRFIEKYYQYNAAGLEHQLYQKRMCLLFTSDLPSSHKFLLKKSTQNSNLGTDMGVLNFTFVQHFLGVQSPNGASQYQILALLICFVVTQSDRQHRFCEQTLLKWIKHTVYWQDLIIEGFDCSIENFRVLTNFILSFFVSIARRTSMFLGSRCDDTYNAENQKGGIWKCIGILRFMVNLSISQARNVMSTREKRQFG